MLRTSLVFICIPPHATTTTQCKLRECTSGVVVPVAGRKAPAILLHWHMWWSSLVLVMFSSQPLMQMLHLHSCSLHCIVVIVCGFTLFNYAPCAVSVSSWLVVYVYCNLHCIHYTGVILCIAFHCCFSSYSVGHRWISWWCVTRAYGTYKNCAYRSSPHSYEVIVFIGARGAITYSLSLSRWLLRSL